MYCFQSFEYNNIPLIYEYARKHLCFSQTIRLPSYDFISAMWILSVFVCDGCFIIHYVEWRYGFYLVLLEWIRAMFTTTRWKNDWWIDRIRRSSSTALRNTHIHSAIHTHTASVEPKMFSQHIYLKWAVHFTLLSSLCKFDLFTHVWIYI